MSVYGAAVLDVVGSKVSPNRSVLQARLNETIARFNEGFRAQLPAPAVITAGDEWEFLTDQPRHIYALVQWFQEALWPDIVVYAGIGLGGLSTPIGDDIRQMDGPCFHLARRAVQIAKGAGGSRHKYIFSKRNRVYLLVESSGADTGVEEKETAAAAEDGGVLRREMPLQEIVNALIENTEILRSRMTAKQKRASLDYRALGTYRRMASSSGGRQTPGGISQMLNTAEYFTIRRNERLIAGLMGTIGQTCIGDGARILKP